MKTIARWSSPDSLWGLLKLQRDFDRLLDGPNTSHAQDFDSSISLKPACDIEETDSHYLVHFDVPGIAKEDINIEVMDETLTVWGERRSEKDEKKGAQHLVERSYGQFRRSFTLPSHVDADKVEANYQDGVLSISVKKAESAKPRQIKIGDGKVRLTQKAA